MSLYSFRTRPEHNVESDGSTLSRCINLLTRPGRNTENDRNTFGLVFICFQGLGTILKMIESLCFIYLLSGSGNNIE